jgi:hypothetical protein
VNHFLIIKANKKGDSYMKNVNYVKAIIGGIAGTAIGMTLLVIMVPIKIRSY